MEKSQFHTDFLWYWYKGSDISVLDRFFLKKQIYFSICISFGHWAKKTVQLVRTEQKKLIVIIQNFTIWS